MQPDHKFIGKKIKEFRLKKNLTQENLAERVELSVTYICMVETGRKHISLQKIVQIADALDVTVDKLIYKSQIKNGSDKNSFILELLSDCSDYELQVFSDMISSTKESMRNNKNLIL